MRPAEEWAKELQKLVDDFGLEFVGPAAEVARAAEEYPGAWRRFARAIQSDALRFGLIKTRGEIIARISELEAGDAANR